MIRRIPFHILGTYVRLLTRGHKKSFSVFTHLTYEERLFLYKTALKLKRGDSIVEIGSYVGASSCFLAAAASDRGSKVYCVDTWKNDGMTEGPKDTYSAFRANTKRYHEVIVPLRMKSEEAESEFRASVDLLFLDGDHSYEAVSADLRAWLPKMKAYAWLVLHDSGWAEGVQRAIREIVVPIEAAKPVVLPNLYAVQILDRQSLMRQRER
jgi:predicted O-methyltransferase YrrM